MKVLYVASEGLPFIKSGGLADVVGSLPKILKKKKVDVRVVLPMYLKIANQYRDEFTCLGTVPVQCGHINTVATFFETEVDGVPFYFVEHQGYFERDGLYGYPDDGERFAFFQKAVLELIVMMKWYPDVLHCHDWHTGAVAMMAKHHYPHDKRMQKMKSVFTIHNLAFQGNFPASVLTDCLGLPYSLFEDGTLRFHGGISMMKAGIVASNKVTTVSNTYAHEILSPYFGENMQDVLRLRQDDLWGIVNGIDTDLWNPASDDCIFENYDMRSLIKSKALNKKSLQFDLGLREDPDVLLIGIVGRITRQKGMQMVLDCMGELMSQDVQLVVLGTGETDLEAGFKVMEGRYRRRAVYYCGYNESLAHKIYAGCDVFLMPSDFEPCGISQLISMRYGTLPIVRETGGLKDTVQPYNKFTQEGNGFSFYAMNGADMMNTIRFASDTYYYSRKEFNDMMKRAMKTDVSWKTSADKYLELYKAIN